MALIHCPECNHEISDKAVACPHCGYPIKEGCSSARKSSDRFWKVIVVSTLAFYVMLGTLGVVGIYVGASAVKKGLSELSVSKQGGMEQMMKILSDGPGAAGVSENSQKQLESMMKLLDGGDMGEALQMLLQSQ